MSTALLGFPLILMSLLPPMLAMLPTHLFISVAMGLAALIAAICWLQVRYHYPAAPAKLADDAVSWPDRWSGTVVRCVLRTGSNTLTRLRAVYLVTTGRFIQAHTWHVVHIPSMPV